jgi:hypothetical protein
VDREPKQPCASGWGRWASAIPSARAPSGDQVQLDERIGLLNTNFQSDTTADSGGGTRSRLDQELWVAQAAWRWAESRTMLMIFARLGNRSFGETTSTGFNSTTKERLKPAEHGNIELMSDV